MEKDGFDDRVIVKVGGTEHDEIGFFKNPDVLKAIGAAASAMVLMQTDQAHMGDEDYLSIISTDFRVSSSGAHKGYLFKILLYVKGVPRSSMYFLLVNPLAQEELDRLMGSVTVPKREWN